MKRLVFFFSAFAIFLFGCGDLDLALSSGRLYTVNAAVNGLTLDECAIIQKESKLSPYFDFNVKDDPDVHSLVVYIKDRAGTKIGPGVQYKLPAANAESADTDAADGENQDASGENGNEKDSAGGEPGADGFLAAETGPSDGVFTTETGKTGSSDDSLAAETEETETGGDIPAGTESGPPDAVSAAESVPAQTGGELQADMVVVVKDFDSGLPDLTFGGDLLKYGAYTIVFEIIATNGAVLNHIEKPFFYLAGRKFAIKEVVSFLPGISTATRIVPPGEKIMLEAGIEADASIDPYVIWYNGKQRISEGLVSDGENRILWTAPDQNVFQNIRAEIFPFDPNKEVFFIPGLSCSVSLPVSQRHGRSGYYSESEARLSRWYRLWGTLDDQKAPSSTVSLLARTDEGTARWLPVSGTYGLAIGADDAYRLPDSFFSRIRRGEGSGEILFLFAPQNGKAADGTILQAVLQGHYAEDENDSVCHLWLSVYTDSLVLNTVGADGTLLTQQVPFPFADENIFVPASVDFQFSETGTTVSIGVGNIETGEIEQWESLEIDFIADGEGSVQFGGSFDLPVQTDEPAGAYPGILNEIALRYNEISPVAPPPPTTPESVKNDEEILADADEKTAADVPLPLPLNTPNL
jgi:hypothetical protein